MALTGLEGHAREDLVVSLAALLCADAGADVTADNLGAVIEASGNKVAPYWAPLFATFAEKMGSFDKLMGGPGVGAAAPAGGAAAAGDAPAAAAAAPVKEEAEEVDLGGGMDMFGGGDGGAY